VNRNPITDVGGVKFTGQDGFISTSLERYGTPLVNLAVGEAIICSLTYTVTDKDYSDSLINGVLDPALPAPGGLYGNGCPDLYSSRYFFYSGAYYPSGASQGYLHNRARVAGTPLYQVANTQVTGTTTNDNSVFSFGNAYVAPSGFEYPDEINCPARAQVALTVPGLEITKYDATDCDHPTGCALLPGTSFQLFNSLEAAQENAGMADTYCNDSDYNTEANFGDTKPVCGYDHNIVSVPSPADLPLKTNTFTTDPITDDSNVVLKGSGVAIMLDLSTKQGLVDPDGQSRDCLGTYDLDDTEYPGTYYWLVETNSPEIIEPPEEGELVKDFELMPAPVKVCVIGPLDYQTVSIANYPRNAGFEMPFTGGVWGEGTYGNTFRLAGGAMVGLGLVICWWQVSKRSLRFTAFERSQK
jgi:hypothetical protein